MSLQSWKFRTLFLPRSPPGRRAETIGLKLKTHGTMTEACVVKDFARGPNGEVAAGERRGATVGFLLCACTGAPRLLRMSAGYATPALVGRRVLAEAKAAAATGAAFSVTLAPPPDVVVALAAGDAVNVGSRAAQESEIPNFKGSFLGRFPLVLADFWTSDHHLERSRSVDAFSGTRARGTLTLKRR